jgi:hypothetical protein
MILAMVKNHPAIGVIDAIIEVVAELAAADGLADDLSNRVAADATRKRPGLARISMGSGKRRSSSALIILAKLLNAGTVSS